MAALTQNQFYNRDSYAKLVSKPHHKRQPSIVIDSPTESYFAGSNVSYGNSSHLRQSICSSADTIDTPTTNSLSTTKASFFSSQQKLHKNSSPQNFSQYIDALKGVENKKRQQFLEKKLILQKNAQQNTRISEIHEQKNEIVDSSDEEEYSIWDNSQPESMGVDCQNFQNNQGNEFTFYQLYRIRQAQLLGNISRRATINEVFTIAEHYKKPVKKTQLAKQQQYLDDNYSQVPSQSQPTSMKLIQSAQQLDQSEFEMQSPNKMFRQRQQISQSIDKIKQISSQNLFKKSQTNIESPSNQSLSYYIKSPKTLLNSGKLLSNYQQSLPSLQNHTNSDTFRQSKQLLNLKAPEQKILSQSSIFAQTARGEDKKCIQISYINPNNQNGKISMSSYQKQQNSQSSIQSNSPVLTKEQRMRLIQKKLENKFNEEKIKISQLTLLKKSQTIKDSIDSPLSSQSKTSQTPYSSKNLNFPQQHMQKQPSYCDIAKFNI